ncbi:F-box protein At3g07870-like [Rhododendron vialii]|uniref:F-box protein At3g07870-like n=1 Tax=Rhododendron vialii TaxID=182163 RepID=UPI00265EF828|nr:F-box protein At3g07870-like [Rhododendron vialii]
MLSQNLPDELVVDILSSLPPKTLVEFTTVRKSWYSLIKNPSFIKTHLDKSLASDSNGYYLCMSVNYSQNKLCTLLSSKTLVEVAKVELPFQCDMSYCTVVGSVNGLVCLVDAFDGRKLYLCNVAIKKYKHIGHSSSILRCIPANPYVLLGFGYHRESNDYKVIRIMYIETGDRGVIHREVEVYRLGEGCWRKVGGAFPWTLLNQLPAAFVNGNLHWVVSSPGREEVDEVVLSFSLGEEVFREIAMPFSHIAEFLVCGSLCVLRECLSLFEYSPFREGEANEKCCLWVMKEYGVSDSWSKQYTIVLEGRVQRLLGITRFDEIVYENQENKVVWYNLESHQTKYSSTSFGGPYRFDVVPFIESLLFLEGGEGVLGLESSFEVTSCEGTTSTSIKEEEES